MEEHEHKLGWDQPSTAWALYEPGKHLLATASMPFDFHVDDIGDHLQSIAEIMLTEPEGIELCQAAVNDNVMGFIIVHELMTNFSMTPLQQHQDDRDLWDVPGSRLARVVLGMDLLGRLFQVIRLHGMDKALPAKYQMNTLTGQIPKALHMMCLAVARQMPDGLDFVEALSKVQFPSHEETVQQLARLDGDPNLLYILQKAKH